MSGHCKRRRNEQDSCCGLESSKRIHRADKMFSLDVKQDHLVMFNTEIASMTSLEDESTKQMKHLAKSKYGVDSKHNATLLKDRPSLQRVWTWISRLGKIQCLNRVFEKFGLLKM